jgi:putative FmdB family regulatory protein
VPLYEYHCKKCDHLFERIQKFSDPLLTICPKCGGDVEQLISAPAIQFKGTGWYVTDYAKRSGGPAPSSSNGKSDVKAEAKAESKSETKSETNAGSKSESKSETKASKDSK